MIANLNITNLFYATSDINVMIAVTIQSLYSNLTTSIHIKTKDRIHCIGTIEHSMMYILLQR